MSRPDPEFDYGDEVAFDFDGDIFTGKIEIIDYRGREKNEYMGCDWSYDIWCECGYKGESGLYKHVPECCVKPLWQSFEEGINSFADDIFEDGR